MRTRITTALAATALLVLAGCGSSGGADSSAGSAGSTTTRATKPADVTYGGAKNGRPVTPTTPSSGDAMQGH